MITEQESTFEGPTETTPVEVTHQTTVSSMTGSGVTTSWSPGASSFFLLIGVIGVTANGLILYALVVSKQHKKHTLILNQNALDLVNCLFVATTIPVVLGNIYLRGAGGYLLCVTLLSDGVAIAAFYGSVINLAAISIERYLKIVHHVWAKNKLRNWMIYAAAAFSWISGIVIVAALMIPTTTVVNGVCISGVLGLSPMARNVYSIWEFLSFYVIILMIFILSLIHI